MIPAVPLHPKTIDGRVLRVSTEILVEVLSVHTLDQVNAMPYEQRLELVKAAKQRIEARALEHVEKLRAERARRKAEAWAKRQPKGSA